MGLRSKNPAPGARSGRPSQQDRNAASSTSVHIEELVLHGFNVADRHRIGDAVQQELTRLFSEQDNIEGLGGADFRPTIDAGSIDVEPGITPESVGSIIAQSLHRGIRA